MLSLAGFVLVLVLLGQTVAPREEVRSSLLIDDFTGADRLSAMGTEWQAFTDRVMGGVSQGAAAHETLAQTACIRLRGQVSLANNGGFIQVALPLHRGREPFDGSAYTGIRITTTGNGESYFIHLRTRDTRLPWQYYAAAFVTDGKWQEIDIPFATFRAENLRTPLDPSRLERLAVVAAKKEFVADVAVAKIALYR